MLNGDAVAAIDDSDFKQVCELVVELMQQFAVPGVAVGILHGEQEHVAGFGVTSIENPLPITAATLFQIGSITKTFTATAIMRLVDMGKLDLNVPVRTYLPNLRLADESVAERVTLRHLLTHTGGWEGEFAGHFGDEADALATAVATFAELPQMTPLGEVFSYSRAGFCLAGRVIEVVAGKSYEAAMKELVFDPLGLNHSYFFATDVIMQRFAVGHAVEDNHAVVAVPWAVGREVHPAGGIVCNILDLLRYAQFHMGVGCAPDGTRLLSEKSLRMMHAPQHRTSRNEAVGLSWFIETVDGVKLIQHGGGTHGQTAFFASAPDQRWAMAVLTNSDDADAVGKALMAFAKARYLGITHAEPQLLTLTRTQLERYVGCYDTGAVCCTCLLQGMTSFCK